MPLGLTRCPSGAKLGLPWEIGIDSCRAALVMPEREQFSSDRFEVVSGKGEWFAQVHRTLDFVSLQSTVC